MPYDFLGNGMSSATIISKEYVFNDCTLFKKQTATTTTTKLVNNEFVKSSFRIKMECVNKRHNADILYLN